MDGECVARVLLSPAAPPSETANALDVARASLVTFDLMATLPETLVDPPAAVVIVGFVVAKISAPVSARPNARPTARPVASALEVIVAVTVRPVPDVIVPFIVVEIEPPAVASASTAPAAAPRPPVSDWPSASARWKTLVVIDTRPVAATVVPVPMPLVTVGESVTSTSAAAMPAPSAALPRRTLPYAGAGRSVVGVNPLFRLVLKEIAPPPMEPPPTVKAPTVGRSVASTVVIPAVNPAAADTPVPL